VNKCIIRCIAKLTGAAIPKHDSGHATTVALKRGSTNGVPVPCELAPSDDLFGNGVRRLVAAEALALGRRDRVGTAQAQVKAIKLI